mgnify:CR=1 FL=1
MQNLHSGIDHLHCALRSLHLSNTFDPDPIWLTNVAAYLQVEVEADGGAPSKAQASVKDAMKRMEQSLVTVRDQYTFATVKLNVHPSIGEFYAARRAARGGRRSPGPWRRVAA